MALFSKEYHPLDSRHPRNRAGAQVGTYGVQTAKSKVRATPVSQGRDSTIQPATASPPRKRFKRKLSQVEQMNALVAETQARAQGRTQDPTPKRTHQPHMVSPFAPAAVEDTMTARKAAPADKKQRSKIGKGFQILSNIDRNIRIGVLIAFAIYTLANPEVRSGLISLVTHNDFMDGSTWGLTGRMNTMPNESSNF